MIERMWVIEEGGAFRESLTNPRGFRDETGVTHGASIFDIWSEDELNAVGVFVVVVDPVPEGHIVVTQELIKEAGVYQFVRTTEAKPIAPEDPKLVTLKAATTVAALRKAVVAIYEGGKP